MLDNPTTISTTINERSFELLKNGTIQCLMSDKVHNEAKEVKFWSFEGTDDSLLLGTAEIDRIATLEITYHDIKDFTEAIDFLEIASSKYYFIARLDELYINNQAIHELGKKMNMFKYEFHEHFINQIQYGEKKKTFYTGIVFLKNFKSMIDEDVPPMEKQSIPKKSLPSGIVPKKTWVQERIISLHNAILCSYDNDEPIPHELISEYQELVTIRGTKQ